MNNILILRTSSNSPDFQSLVKLLDSELKEFDGEEHTFYSQYNKIENIKHVVVAYAAPPHPLPEGEGQNIAVGCGTIKEFSDDTAEVKRMYVNNVLRGKGIGRKILAELEKWALELNYKYLILETGKRQREAVALYSNSGFEIIPNYGQYRGIDNSICFRKLLK
jgi:GNAT superfamily N-acetyltransferase